MPERDVLQAILDKNKPQTGTISLAEAQEAEKTDPKFAPVDKTAIRAKIARILERGIINERLQVNLPDGIYGEWVTDDPAEIVRMKDLGFEIDKEYAKNRVLHASGDGAMRTGDVVFMTAPMWVKEMIDEVKHTRFMEQHFPKRKIAGKSNQAEEESFASDVKAKLGMPVIEESDARQVKKAEIEAALSKPRT